MPHAKPPSKNQIKKWRKLQQKKYREEYGLFIAEGVRCARQILDNALIDVECMILSEKLDDTGLVGKITDSTEVYTMPEKDFNELADTENPQGIIAVCHIPEPRPVQDVTGLQGMIVAADAVRDPGNLGTIIRTAAWFGAAGLLCGTATVDPWHPKVVRSTAGATGAVPVWSGDLEKLLQPLEEKGWRILLLDGGEGSIPVSEFTSHKKNVLVVGNEANGIQPALLASGREKMRIEGNSAAVESLNAAMALGIALYALSRC